MTNKKQGCHEPKVKYCQEVIDNKGTKCNVKFYGGGRAKYCLEHKK